MGSNEIIADIEYNPYAVLIAHIEAEKFYRNRGGMAIFSEASDIFTRECCDYYRILQTNLHSFARHAVNGPINGRLLKSDDFLFNPACFVGFGDTDNIAVVAMDDFDLSTRLISRVDLPIRQTCLAFSPKVASLGLNKDIFCEIKDICNTPLDRDPDDGEEEAWKAKIQNLVAPRHSFLRERPLVAITYYKFNGMAVLGPGLLMQQAAYRALAEEVEKAIGEMTESDDKRIAGAAASFKCALLDPQGWADLASIMLCRDYSVIASVLARIRSLTHQDLYMHHSPTSSQKLEEHVKCFGLHDKMALAFKEAACDAWKQDWQPDELFRDNHIFCSTFSTFGISHEAFEAEKPEDYVSGNVIADTKFVCHAGHCEKVKEIARDRYKAPSDPKKAYLWYLVGHDDFVYQQMLDEEYDSGSVVRLVDFIRQVKSMRDCDMSANHGILSYLSLHALEMSSDLRIPIVGKLELSSLSIRHIETRLVLDHCRKWLFDEDHENGLSLKALQDALRNLQLPTPLSTSVRFLFLDYANCLGDVFLFDHVMDLHDVLVAVYDLLVRRLTKNMTEGVKSAYEARTFLDGADLDNIVEMVELLRSALSNRIQMGFREAERWGITLDIRGGGFNRLLNAADVPLKCGLGLLWRVIKGDSRLKPSDAHSPVAAEAIKRRIGGASRITYDSRSYSHRLDIGYNRDYFITSVDLNLIYLTRPRNLLIHFHETAHLICHFLRDEVGCAHPSYACKQHRIECHKCPMPVPEKRSDSHLRDRFEDIFSEMLVHTLVFGDDHKTYLRNYTANYSIGSIPYDNDLDKVFFRVFELLMRGFLITDPFRRPDLYTEGKAPEVTPELLEDGFKQFQEVIEDVSSFLIGYEDFLKNAPESKKRYYFNEVFSESYHPVRCIADDVQAIYCDICQNKLDPSSEDAESLRTQIKTGLKKGRPLVRMELEDARPGRDSEESGHLDALYLVRQLLRQHIFNLFGNIDTQKYTACLVRGIDGRPDPEAAPKGKNWNKQCLDKPFNGLVAADPFTRGQYMRERIVLIKSLWDISTNLRARRMLDILKVVWPKL